MKKIPGDLQQCSNNFQSTCDLAERSATVTIFPPLDILQALIRTTIEKAMSQVRQAGRQSCCPRGKKTNWKNIGNYCENQVAEVISVTDSIEKIATITRYPNLMPLSTWFRWYIESYAANGLTGSPPYVILLIKNWGFLRHPQFWTYSPISHVTAAAHQSHLSGWGVADKWPAFDAH